MNTIKIKEDSIIYFLNNINEFVNLIDFETSKVVFFASKKVEDYLNKIQNIFKEKQMDVYTYLTSDGEENKNINKAILFTQFLSLNNIGRNDIIINIGGGTICDLGAFVASIYMRGIRYINIPTTLLCAVDACVGGKTAIDTGDCKNIWGTFYQPYKVIIDYDFLNCLPNNLIKDGLSEIVKYAILNNDFESFLNSYNIDSVNEYLNQIIYKSLKIKAYYVKNDEYDRGERKYLNLGHTVAHAIEVSSNYKIEHSLAVAYGLIYETQISYKTNLISKSRYDNIMSICNKFLIATEKIKLIDILPFMLKDKKNEGYNIVFALPAESGVVLRKFNYEQLKEIIINL